LSRNQGEKVGEGVPINTMSGMGVGASEILRILRDNKE
jgi:hypothetical protein